MLDLVLHGLPTTAVDPPLDVLLALLLLATTVALPRLRMDDMPTGTGCPRNPADSGDQAANEPFDAIVGRYHSYLINRPTNKSATLEIQDDALGDLTAG